MDSSDLQACFPLMQGGQDWIAAQRKPNATPVHAGFREYSQSGLRLLGPATLAEPQKIWLRSNRHQ